MDFEGFNFEMSIRIYKDEKVFGPGIAALLENVEKYQSLNKATAYMGMAYSKAWKIIKNAEKALEVSLLDRQIGGSGGGGATLSKEGRELLTKYNEFISEANKETKKVFEKYFIKDKE